MTAEQQESGRTADGPGSLTVWLAGSNQFQDYARARSNSRGTIPTALRLVVAGRGTLVGVIHRAPIAKTSRAGHRYASALIVRGAAQLWTCSTSDEGLIQEFIRLRCGEAVAVRGKFSCDRSTRAGARPNLTIWAEDIRSLGPVFQRHPALLVEQGR